MILNQIIQRTLLYESTEGICMHTETHARYSIMMYNFANLRLESPAESLNCRAHAPVCAFVYICVYVYVYMVICVCVCVCVHGGTCV